MGTGIACIISFCVLILFVASTKGQVVGTITNIRSTNIRPYSVDYEFSFTGNVDSWIVVTKAYMQSGAGWEREEPTTKKVFETKQNYEFEFKLIPVYRSKEGQESSPTTFETPPATPPGTPAIQFLNTSTTFVIVNLSLTLGTSPIHLYEFSYGPYGSSPNSWSILQSLGPRIHIGQLKGYSTYSGRGRATDIRGLPSSQSTIVHFNTNYGQIEELNLRSSNTTSLTISWIVSPPYFGVEFQTLSRPGVWAKATTIANTTNAITLYGLSHSTVYTVRARTYFNNLEPADWFVKEFKTQSPVPPSAPILTVELLTQTSVTLSWSNPTAGTYPVSNFTLYILNQNIPYGNPVYTGSELSRSVVSLASGIHYKAKVQACDINNLCSNATEIFFDTPIASIINLKVVAFPLHLQLSWQQTAEAFDSFRINWTDTVTTTAITARSPYNITGLTPMTQYIVSVNAIKSGFREGLPENTTVRTTAAIPPIAPILSIFNVGQSTASANWTSFQKQTYDFAEYRLYIFTGSSESLAYFGKETSVDMSNLKFGTLYKVYLEACDTSSACSRSATVSFTTRIVCTSQCLNGGVCVAPDHCDCRNGWHGPSTGCDTYLGVPPSVVLQVHGVPDYRSIDLSWNQPMNFGTSKNISGYIVLIYVEATNSWKEIYNGVNSNTTVTSLLPGEIYQFEIAAYSYIGTGESNISSFTTKLPTSPNAPSKPILSKLNRHTIDFSWKAPSDTGGHPILAYTLQIYNLTSILQVEVNSTIMSYQAVGLEINTTYRFAVQAKNLLGNSSFSQIANFTTAHVFCGDRICDKDYGETCSTCYLDCGTCGYLACDGTPECSGNGECIKGVCACSYGAHGNACQFKNAIVNVTIEPDAPTASVNIDDGSLSATQFSISFTTIREVDSQGNTLESYDLKLQNLNLTANQSSMSVDYVYYILLPNSAKINVYISVFKNDTTVVFAEEEIKVPKYGLKYSMKVQNWPFKSLTNQLLISMHSMATNDNPCRNEKEETSIRLDESSNLRFIRLSANGVELYGKFTQFAYFDDEIKTVQYYYNSTSRDVVIVSPHFWDYVEFDPDFQVLLTGENRNSDDCDNIQSEKSNGMSSKIIGGVVGGVLGAAILVAGAGAAIKIRNKKLARQRLHTSSMSEMTYASSN